MKDSVVRGCLPQLLYERQSEGFIPFGQAEQAVPPPVGINRRDWLRAVAQLSEYRLIDWTPLEDKSGMGLLSGFAKINDLGVKVLEAGVDPRSGFPLIRASEPKLLGSNKRRSQRSLRLITTLAFLAVYLLIGVAVCLLRHALTTAARTDPEGGAH